MLRSTKRRGATMVAVVAILPLLFLLASMAINLSYIQVARTRVQIATDAAARSAGRVYVENYDEAAALAAAQEMATLNPVFNKVIPITAADLEFGLCHRNTHNKAYTFTPQSNGNAVRVRTHAFSAGTGTSLNPIFPTFGVNLDIRPLCTATNAQTTLDIALVIDRSGSMAFSSSEVASGTPTNPSGWAWGDPIPAGSRWLDLVAAVQGFTNELEVTAKDEKVALCSYADNGSIDLDLTEAYADIHSHIHSLSSSFAGGSTNIGDGIQKGLDAIDGPGNRPWATRAVIVMSDGINTVGPDPLTVIENAIADTIPIYTVSFSDQADQVLMQQIADDTGGTHYHAEDAAQLIAAFRDIARRLPSMLTE